MPFNLVQILSVPECSHIRKNAHNKTQKLDKSVLEYLFLKDTEL